MGKLISHVERTEEIIPLNGSGKVISLDEARNRREDPEGSDIVYMLPLIEYEDTPAINSLKQKVGALIGYDYLIELSSLAKKGKNILSKGNITGNTLPYNIGYHLGKMRPEEKLKLAGEIGNMMKSLPNARLKEQLFYFRSRILATINNN